MKIAVLFDGAGLARLGLEQAGHECVGVELDYWKHYLSKFVGKGNCICGDATEFDLSDFDAVWASPPCQFYSDQNHGTVNINDKFKNPDLLTWSLKIKTPILWVENVINKHLVFGQKYNAVQFLKVPVQQRRRMVGGSYKEPKVFRKYKAYYPEFKEICPPAVLASELKQGSRARTWKKERRKFTRWYFYKKGRMPTIEDMAKAQGFKIPKEWYNIPDIFTKSKWTILISQVIGNGVPVYMSKAFGEVYK
jgi:site-specific DNA-cytosine methylase